MYAELGACLGNGCLHVYGIGCMYAELGACLGNGPWLACGVGCLSGSRVFSQAPKLALARPQPGPGPRGATLCSKAPAGALLHRAYRILGGLRPPRPPNKSPFGLPDTLLTDTYRLTHV